MIWSKGNNRPRSRHPPGQASTQVWTKEQRAAEINAEHERQEQQKLNRSNDNEPPGPTFEP